MHRKAFGESYRRLLFLIDNFNILKKLWMKELYWLRFKNFSIVELAILINLEKKLVYSSEQCIESYKLTVAFKIRKFHVHWPDGINCKTVNLIKKKSLKLNTTFSLFNLDNFFFNVSLAFALYCIMYHNHLSLITNNRIMCLRHRPLLCSPLFSDRKSNEHLEEIPE